MAKKPEAEEPEKAPTAQKPAVFDVIDWQGNKFHKGKLVHPASTPEEGTN
jgi:hypothetical protein